MAVIEIKLDILNSKELVTREKGKLTGFIAGLVMNEATLKSKVEEKVCLEIIEKLKDAIVPGLVQEGVKAEISFTLVLKEEIRIPL